MALTCGFFNSMDHDRIYDARQFARIFDGVITDGIYATIGDCFVVRVQSGRIVTVGTGRAWFNGTWTLNDSLLPIEMPLSDVASARIDVVVLEVDTRDSVRDNSIKVVMGTPAANPQVPELITEDGVYQYPLCYIHRPTNSTSINQADITNKVGSAETPFVTGILRTISLDELLGQWQAELDNFVSDETADFSKWWYEKRQEFEAWVEEQKALFGDYKGENDAFYQQWIDATQNTFNAWFEQLQTNLGSDAAGNLQLQIQADSIKRILTSGFADGVKTISRDGRTIISTADDGRKLTKVFSDDFSTMTATLTSPLGALIATMIKTFSPSGDVINTITTYTYGRGIN